MSTDLVGVRILAVDRPARRVRMRVFVVYYDCAGGYHETLPYDASFFARALSSAARWYGTSGVRGGLLDAGSSDDWHDELWLDANTWRFVERFDEVHTRNEPVRDYAGFQDFYSERQGRWVDEEKLVQGDYDVWLTEERWLDGVVLGASFGTTDYNTQADTGDRALVERLPEPQRALASFTLAERAEGDAYSPAPVLLTVSDDGRWLACGDLEGRLRVIDTECWSVCHDSAVHRGSGLEYAEFAPGEPTLLLPGDRALTLPDGPVVQRAHGLASDQGPARCEGSGRVRVVRTYDDPEDTYGWHLVDEHGARILANETPLENPRWTLSRDDRSFAVLDGTRLELWDVVARARVHDLKLPGYAQTAAFSPDGTLVLVGFSGHDLRGFGVYEVATGREVRRITPRISPPLHGRQGPHEGPLTVTLALWTARYVALAEERITRTFDSLGSSLRAFECGPAAPFVEAAAQDSAPSTIDHALARRIAGESAVLTDEALAARLTAHAKFLARAALPDREQRLWELYPDPLWEVLSVAGLPLALSKHGEPAPLEGADRAVFRLANLRGAALTGAPLAFADLTGVFAQAASFAGADLYGACLADGSFEGADFAGADLRWADLSRANLRGAKLRHARLASADFEGADLTDADFTGAHIAGVQLKRAVVEGVRGFGTELPAPS